MTPAPPSPDAQPLVSCIACGFAWYGRTAAHGLSVVGRCTRCGGALEFHAPPVGAEAAQRAAGDVQPWQVLGRPTSWAGH